MAYRDEQVAKIERMEQELAQLRGDERGLYFVFKWVMLVGYVFSAIGLLSMAVALIVHQWRWWPDVFYTCFAGAYVAEHTRAVVRAVRALRRRSAAARGESA